MFGALAEFERDLVRERTLAGLAAARARGKKGGRRPKLTPQQVALAQKMHADAIIEVETILRTLKISRATLYRYIQTGSRKH